MAEAGNAAAAGGKAAAAAVEPIIELVEVVHVRYLVLAALVGLAIGIGILYLVGRQNLAREGTDDGSGS